MPRRYERPIAVYQHGTRVYAPTDGEPQFRIISRDFAGRRVFTKVRDEDEARRRGRDLDAAMVETVAPQGRPPNPTNVAQLAEHYLRSLSARSVRYRERQEFILRIYVVPVIGRTAVRSWTPAQSEHVLDEARQVLSPSTVRNVGSTMRALVTFAMKNRWIARDSDPMWMVRYNLTPEHQGEALGFIPRSVLPTDEECQAIFDALEKMGHPTWSLAMRLKHRCGARWGELVALRPCDLDFEPQRVVRIGRAVEQSRLGFAMKSTKNRQRRSTVFPASLTDDLRAHCEEVARAAGPEGLLFTAAKETYADRKTFNRLWTRAAMAAGWPMRT